ncbi:protein of unknown function [Xenorhabdus doucetiae]|uniref:Uncharacterized protein n=1 Tax=Xenorhabdus doucetiae TaxID=351671 RepID=A0A068QVF1_9GAMM|nr:protein of unknown function [Xenorhabdus doucetiae]
MQNDFYAIAMIENQTIIFIELLWGFYHHRKAFVVRTENKNEIINDFINF